MYMDCLPATNLVNCADLFKQFGPRSDPTEHRARSESKVFDTGIVPERFFEKVFFLKQKVNIRQKNVNISLHSKSLFAPVLSGKPFNLSALKDLTAIY